MAPNNIKVKVFSKDTTLKHHTGSSQTSSLGVSAFSYLKKACQQQNQPEPLKCAVVGCNQPATLGAHMVRHRFLGTTYVVPTCGQPTRGQFAAVIKAGTCAAVDGTVNREVHALKDAKLWQGSKCCGKVTGNADVPSLDTSDETAKATGPGGVNDGDTTDVAFKA